MTTKQCQHLQLTWLVTHLACWIQLLKPQRKQLQKKKRKHRKSLMNFKQVTQQLLLQVLSKLNLLNRKLLPIKVHHQMKMMKNPKLPRNKLLIKRSMHLRIKLFPRIRRQRSPSSQLLPNLMLVKVNLN